MLLLLAVLLPRPGCAEEFYPAPLTPADNPSTPAKVALGKRLFSETALSVTGAYSCASCHQPDKDFTDGLARAVGATGQLHEFNTPTLYNVAFNASLGWTDQGLHTLEQQHLVPLQNTSPVEMGYQPHMLSKLAADADYRQAFQAVFAAPPNTADVVRAIASYVRTLRAPQSAFDRYLFFDDTGEFGAQQRHGMQLFFSPRLGCSECHASLSFSGPVQHTLQQAQPAFHVTAVGGASRAFRAPTLRRVAHTAPYMHNGSLKTLHAVLQHYQQVRVERVPEFTLSTEEQQALLAFLRSL